MTKSAGSKARVRGSAKERVVGKNSKEVDQLLTTFTQEKVAATKKGVPFILDPSISLARVTVSQGGGTFTVDAPGQASIQIRAKGNKALADSLAQRFKLVKLATDLWPIVAVLLPPPSSHNQCGELLAIVETDQVPLFAELGFKTPAGFKEEDDLFEAAEVEISDL